MFAIPYNDARVAGHFSKAEQFLFVDGDTHELVDNPAVQGEGCSGKKSLLALFKQQNVDKVIVRNIGQKMLAKLFSAGIRVFQAPPRVPLDRVLTSELAEFTHVSQARPSKNAARSGGCGKSHSSGGCNKAQKESLLLRGQTPKALMGQSQQALTGQTQQAGMGRGFRSMRINPFKTQ